MSGITRRKFVNLAAGMSVVLATKTGFGEEFKEVYPPAVWSPPTVSMKSFRLAAISTRSLPGAPEKNLEHMVSWLAQARDKGAALACFPELSVTGYVLGRQIWKVSEPVPGPSTQKLETLAKRFNLIIAAGIAEKDRGIVYDTYVFVGPEGYMGKSRKMHIPPAEVGSWRGGGVAPVIDIGLAKVGVNICFDNWLPESSRLVALQGAEIIFAPFVWGGGKLGNPPDHSQRNRRQKVYAGHTLPARAIDNGTFLVYVNDCGMAASGEYRESVVLVYSPAGNWLPNPRMRPRAKSWLLLIWITRCW